MATAVGFSNKPLVKSWDFVTVFHHNEGHAFDALHCIVVDDMSFSLVGSTKGMASSGPAFRPICGLIFLSCLFYPRITVICLVPPLEFTYSSICLITLTWLRTPEYSYLTGIFKCAELPRLSKYLTWSCCMSFWLTAAGACTFSLAYCCFDQHHLLVFWIHLWFLLDLMFSSCYPDSSSRGLEQV